MGKVIHREKTKTEPLLVQEVESQLQTIKREDVSQDELNVQVLQTSRGVSPMLLELERQIQTLYDEISYSEYDSMDDM